MKSKITKVVVSLLIFLLCVNIHGLMSMFLNVEKSISITYQDESVLNTSNGSGSLILKVGKFSGPVTLEPVDCWNYASRDVIDQVVETLFMNNLSNPELPRVNHLAETYWWENTTTLHIKLREGILFHDNTPFNSSAAKWNLDRLLYLTNATGTNTGEIVHTAILWMFPDGATPIIANVSVVGNWNITINLNAPFAPLLDLLSYINAGMVSPSSTPATEFIDLLTGQIIGTGPFKYNYYNPNIEVKFTRWDNYWKPPAFFEEMLFIIYNDTEMAHFDMLAYKIDILEEPDSQDLIAYDTDPNIMVKRFTKDTGKPSLKWRTYGYLGFNNQKYNRTWRKAMSHAINYTYILEDIRQGNDVKANSPISPSFGDSYNASATAAVYNITKAREIMQSMGFGVGYTADWQWTDHANSANGTTPFLSVPNTFDVNNGFREDLFIMLSTWFKQIGIEVVEDGVTWSEYLNYLFDDYDHLGIFAIEWGPDYLEPFNMLDALFNPESGSNSGQVNDTWLNTQMALALNTIDDTARNNIYKKIQSYMAEIGYFHAYIFHSEVPPYVHLSEIRGVPYNAMDRFYAYPIYSVAPGPFTISSDAENPDPNGNFTLSWTESLHADNYTVYRHSSYITTINGTLTALASEITETNLTINNLSEGTYYFIVEALNASGNTLSNCIEIRVIYPIPTPPKSFILSSTADNPDIDGNFNLIWGSSDEANNYSIYQHSALITEINSSLTLLSIDYNETTFSCDDYSDGVYYFKIVAYNNFGVNFSNCLRITVLISPVIPPEIPGYEPLFIIGVIVVSSYMLIRKRKKIS